LLGKLTIQGVLIFHQIDAAAGDRRRAGGIGQALHRRGEGYETFFFQIDEVPVQRLDGRAAGRLQMGQLDLGQGILPEEIVKGYQKTSTQGALSTCDWSAISDLRRR